MTRAALLSAARQALLDLAIERGDATITTLGVLPLTHVGGAPRTTVNGKHRPVSSAGGCSVSAATPYAAPVTERPRAEQESL